MAINRLGIKIALNLAVIIGMASISQPPLKADEGNTGEVFHQVLESDFLYMPSSDADGMAGEVTAVSSISKYSNEFKAFDKLPLKLSFKHNYTGLDNSTAVKLPARLVGLSFDLEATLPFFNLDKAYLRLGVSPSFFQDDWDLNTSSFRLLSRYYAIYKPNDKWVFVGGVAYYPEFEYSVLPILGFIYQPNDRLTFRLVPERPEVSYMLNDRVTLFTEAGNSFDEYEVTKDNLKNVVLQYREIHLGAGVRYRINKTLKFSLSAGGMFNRYLNYRDSLGKVDIKNGMYAGFRLQADL